MDTTGGDTDLMVGAEMLARMVKLLRTDRRLANTYNDRTASQENSKNTEQAHTDVYMLLRGERLIT